jgi:hypothetical protein
MIATRLQWLGNGLIMAGLTIGSTANAQNAPPRNDMMRVMPKRQEYKVRASNEKPPAKALIPPAIIASVGFTGFLVSGIIYEYTGIMLERVHNCNGATCPQDRPLQTRAQELRAATTPAMVTSGLVFGVGLIWFAILAPNANTTAPAKASVVPVITPNGVFLTGRF